MNKENVLPEYLKYRILFHQRKGFMAVYATIINFFVSENASELRR